MMGLGSGAVGRFTSRGESVHGSGSGAESDNACLENKNRRYDPVFSVVPRMAFLWFVFVCVIAVVVVVDVPDVALVPVPVPKTDVFVIVFEFCSK
jgi:hypothetical protein